MSKEKEEIKEIVDSPFANFSILDTPGKTIPHATESIKETKDGLVKEVSGEEKENTIDEDEQAEATRLLEEVSKKQADALIKSKNKTTKHVDNTPEEVVEEKDEDVEEQNSLKPFASFLSDKGIIEYDEKEFEDSEDGLAKVFDKTVEKRVEEWKKSYPEDTQKFLEFVENGGNPKQFLNAYYNTATWEGFIVDNETTQKHTIREGLKLAGYDDPEEIEEEIKLYEDSGKLETKAKGFLNKLQKSESEFKKQIVENQKQNSLQRESEAKKYYDNLHKTWFEKEELNGFKLNKKAKEEIWDFIYKIDKKSGKTGLQESYENNIDAQFMYAYLAKNNFDIGSLEKIVKTKVTSDLRKSLNKYTDSRSKISSGRTASDPKPGSENEGNFAGFRQIV